ncbi:DUF1073 domain-containing protein [Salinarimonas soli]|uniref:DUF1073 domain-containing protein n=1 Tax=Salinarimonas soli TaxID=1638099 RepID=A0A5B2VDT6_9HYPH|nr:DUF1073 domain-containing protein [Salinarimonas soli]KAA2237683.1 DUF1073 domain-containing protein [Salinarimonas soli]
MSRKNRRHRVTATAARPTPAAPLQDGFRNVATRTGQGAGNAGDAATYVTNSLSSVPRVLEAMYRSAWLPGLAVDIVADDMTRAGVEISGTTKPDDIEEIDAAIDDLAVMTGVNEAIKWARLYGGGLAVMLIDGQDVSTPLRVETIKQGQFRGLLAMDRWLVQTSSDLVTEFGPDLGKPVYYDTAANAPALRGKRIHHSRVIRVEGLDLPFYQRQQLQGWGMSVIERLYDRLTAFDSATLGAAQLVHKAHLRTLSIDGLRELLAAGGPGLAALARNVAAIREYQTAEGLTLVDAKDKFETHQYTFSGLSDVILQFGQQISGALQIPLVRLFGQSPAGLNASGDADLRTYYDGVAAQQNRVLRRPFTVLLDVLHRSVLGTEPQRGFGFRFRPLWQLSDTERATNANTVTTAVVGAFDSGVIGRQTALRELRQASDATGVWSNITDEEIDDAEADPPAAGEALDPDPDQDDAVPDPEPDDAADPDDETDTTRQAA